MSNSVNSQNNTYTAIGEWAVGTFGFGKPTSCYLKLGEEFGELARPIQKKEYDKAALEMADIIVVLSHMAMSMGIDLECAVNEKMAVNRARTWTMTKEGTGVHVEGESRPAKAKQSAQPDYNESDTLP